MQMEEFYAAAKESDYLIYNSTIDGEIHSISELLAMLEDIHAIFSGSQEDGTYLYKLQS